MDARIILNAARIKGWHIGVAESCTGGGLGAALTAIAGSSDVFFGGIIAYSNDVKIELLDVEPKVIAKYGAVSEKVTAQMANGICRKLNVEIGVSISGVAGPGAEGKKPEGRVCFGYVTPNISVTETIEFGAIGRENVRQAAILHALRTLNSHIAQ